MLAVIRRFFVDENYFRSLLPHMVAPLRAVIAAVALAITTGQLDLGRFGYWAGPIGLGAALMLKAGDKNVPLTAQVQSLSEPERQAVHAALQPVEQKL